MPPITIEDVRFFVIVFLLLAVIEAGWMAVKLLERCDLHLRALHVRELDARDGRPQTEDDRLSRREALGLTNGYPFAVRRSALGGLVGWMAVYAVARWWLAA